MIKAVIKGFSMALSSGFVLFGAYLFLRTVYLAIMSNGQKHIYSLGPVATFSFGLIVAGVLFFIPKMRSIGITLMCGYLLLGVLGGCLLSADAAGDFDRSVKIFLLLTVLISILIVCLALVLGPLFSLFLIKKRAESKRYIKGGYVD